MRAVPAMVTRTRPAPRAVKKASWWETPRSRGFVVLSADYPGLVLADQLCSTLECGCATSGAQDIPGDVNTQIAALKSATGDLAFLAGHLDTARLAISGHSQGGCITSTLSTLADVQLVIPMSASTNVTNPAGAALMPNIRARDAA